ncbi:MAG: AAA family ATPase [Proteiniphilum sp.]|jgi:predicted AAA+ superfamily ATPase|uniref:ATP-binding protein n=1 Tax=Proteiniphilum sp. TaxID=1926877 RepID=UPI002B1EF2C2|nr:AAA family ATPase [Proteiniphilum sp.]MEA5126583.1 AAA family ATPase [Proteiniphilum sp.]
MFRRDIETELQRWAENPYRKPLILRGARQVGKTTVVNNFGKKFDNYLSVNLEKSSAKQLMESTDEVKKLLPLLFFYCNVKRKEGRTLLFIDEIQQSTHSVSLLRYFYEELPEIYVIAAGSLLETMLEKQISIPVGRAEFRALHPCTFTEFLIATGNQRYIEAITEPSLSVAFHQELMNLFNIYALIGGMPEVVARYTAEQDIVSLSATYNQLLNAYKSDVEKYAETSTQAAVIRYILEEGWAFSGQNITFGGFAESSYKARETGEAFRTLGKAMLLELAYPVTQTVLPAISDLKKSPKLFWVDAGLVNYSARIQKEYLLSKDLMDTWRGAAAEQIVAQELQALSYDVGFKLNYWMRNKRGSTAEVDFIWIQDGKIIPIEVKSGHNAHLKSIHQFMNDADHDVAIRIWSGTYSVDKVVSLSKKEFRLINLPFYMISRLPWLVTKW